MKLFRTIIILPIFILMSCTSVQSNVTPEFATATAFAEITKEITPITAQQTAENENRIEVTGGDEEALRDFISLWFEPVYPTGSTQKLAVSIGNLPQDIPLDIPLPNNVRIVGSATGYPIEYSIILSAGQSPETIQEFYEGSLIEKGWHDAPTQGGFGYETETHLFSGYCYEENTAFLQVETSMISDTETAIRLGLDMEPDAYRCDSGTYIEPFYMSLLPILHAPTGITVTGTSSGGGIDTDGNITMTLEGDISEIAVMENYANQLTTAGWVIKTTASGDGVAWSSWVFSDENGARWTGMLIVNKSSPDSNTLFVLLRVSKDE
jgi:hypothetical protein